MKSRVAILIALTVVLDYLYLIWYDDTTVFIHWNGREGWPMYWHVHQLGMMINFIILGAALQVDKNWIDKAFCRAYLQWQILLTLMYLYGGTSTSEIERSWKSGMFFIFVLINLLCKKT